ncbi:hypothetical protein LguiA_021165 [Lonicera macranthoides]
MYFYIWVSSYIASYKGGLKVGFFKFCQGNCCTYIYTSLCDVGYLLLAKKIGARYIQDKSTSLYPTWKGMLAHAGDPTAAAADSAGLC